MEAFNDLAPMESIASSFPAMDGSGRLAGEGAGTQLRERGRPEPLSKPDQGPAGAPTGDAGLRTSAKSPREGASVGADPLSASSPGEGDAEAAGRDGKS